jgi:hypothetical protein
MKYDLVIESVSVPKGGPPQVETDPEISTFTKWLEKTSVLSDPQVSDFVCFIKLITVSHRPACYLALTETDGVKNDVLFDVKDLGTTFVWPDGSQLSKQEFLAQAEHALLQFKKQCKTESCLFYKAFKVAVGYSGNDFRIVDFKNSL